MVDSFPKRFGISKCYCQQRLDIKPTSTVQVKNMPSFQGLAHGSQLFSRIMSPFQGSI